VAADADQFNGLDERRSVTYPPLDDEPSFSLRDHHFPPPEGAPMNILPIDLTAIVAIVMGMLAVLIPVAGLTARFALKPIVEAIARMREGQNGQQELSLLQQRVALLEQQVQNVEHTVDRVAEEREFNRQLAAPRV
jgi:hypothetical protein